MKAVWISTESDNDGVRSWYDVDGEHYAKTIDGELLDSDGYPLNSSGRDSVYVLQAIDRAKATQ